MKKWLLMLVGLFSLLPQMRADEGEKAQQILDWIRGEKGDSLVAHFHESIKSLYSVPELNLIWPQLEKQAGRYEGRSNWMRELRDSVLMEQCRLIFEEGQVRFVLLTDGFGKVVGFHFTPIVKRLEARDSVQTADFIEKDTVIVNGSIRLPATICIPNGGGHQYPVMLLVHGLGPTDRDGTIGPNKPYRELAHCVAAKGIASLRYDKRSFVYGTRPSKFGDAPTYDTEVVDDAVAALDVVAGLPEINPDSIFLFGHSLGGMLAPRIAMLGHTRLAGMVTVAAAARTMEDWLYSQFRYLAKVQGTSVEQADSLTQIIYSKMPLSYRSFADEYNPVGTARGLHIPMLFIQGGHDFQVTEEDFSRWKQGLEGCKDVHFVWLDNCDHLLRDVPTVSTPADYMIPGKISRQAIDEILNFIFP